MPDLSLICSRYGRIGTIESILPEFVMGLDVDGQRISCWPSSVGMVRIASLKEIDGDMDLTPDLLASMIISRDDRKPIDITEFHGVMFFDPIDGSRWHEQINNFKSHPSQFDVIPIPKLQEGREYAFFARRVARVARPKRKVLK